VPYFLQAKPRS